MTVAHGGQVESPAPSDRTIAARPRVLLNYIFGFAYCVIMYVTYSGLSTFWAYIGFDFVPLGVELPLVIAAAALPTAFLPSHPTTMRELAAWILSYTLFMPALLVPQLQGWIPIDERLLLFINILACSIAFIVLVQRKVKPMATIAIKQSFFWTAVIGAWVVMHGGIVFFFGSNLSLVGVDQVYEQRANSSAAVGSAVLISYILSNASGALNPFLLAAGFFERRWALVGLGALGQLIIYSALAGKIVIVFIGVVLGAFALFDRNGTLKPLRFAAGVLTVAIIGMVTFPFYDPGAGFLNDIYDLIFVRTLYLPGVLVGAYYSFFSTYPVTYFSHMILGQFFFTYPYGGQSVGQVIGAYVTPSSSYAVNNYNANFIAADGITGLGLAGIPLVFVIMLLVLRAIDGAAANVDLRMRCAALIPFIMWLSDGSLFTALVTGGGALITLLLWSYGCVQRHAAMLSPPRDQVE